MTHDAQQPKGLDDLDEKIQRFVAAYAPDLSMHDHAVLCEGIMNLVAENDTRSRSHPAPAPDVVLSHMPSPCTYLLIEGMNVRCLDSTPRSRIDCDHHVNWHCWDLSNQREVAIRAEAARQAREDVLKEATTRLQLILENPNKTLPWQLAPISQCIHLLESLRGDHK